MRKEVGRNPVVVLQPETRSKLWWGIEQMSRLVIPTLGPRTGSVIVAPITSKYPEVLEKGGQIVRRTIQLSDRSEDVGAMFLRGLLWDIHEQTGDGVATACVLFKAVLDAASNHLDAGVGAAELREKLLWGLELILEELDRLTQSKISVGDLGHTAQTLCRHDELAAKIGEIFAVSGVYSNIEVRKGSGDNIEFEFIDGAYWKSSVHSTSMLSNLTERRVDIQRCRILISDLDIQDEVELANLIAITRRSGAGGLLIIAKSITASCTALILANTTPAFEIVGVHTPRMDHPPSHSALIDIEVLTNGRSLHAAAGDLIGNAKLSDLGSAKHVWADRAYFGIIRPGSDPFRRRKHVAELQACFDDSDDTSDRDMFALRISRLSSSSAVIWMTDRLTQAAESTAAGVRLAMLGGVLPGGGSALVACQSVLEPLLQSAMPGAERAALQILLTALEAPMKTLIQNAGIEEPAPVLARVKETGDRCGWDAVVGDIANMQERGVLDPAIVTKTATRKAIAGAAQALTIDTIVHRRFPEQSMRP